MCRVVSNPMLASLRSISSYDTDSKGAIATEESALEPAMWSLMHKYHLKLPKTTDEWADANALLKHLVPRV